MPFLEKFGTISVIFFVVPTYKAFVKSTYGKHRLNRYSYVLPLIRSRKLFIFCGTSGDIILPSHRGRLSGFRVHHHRCIYGCTCRLSLYYKGTVWLILSGFYNYPTGILLCTATLYRAMNGKRYIRRYYSRFGCFVYQLTYLSVGSVHYHIIFYLFATIIECSKLNDTVSRRYDAIVPVTASPKIFI